MVTFAIGQTHIERLKDLVSIQCVKNYPGQSEFLGENGIIVAAKAIGKKVKELAEKWLANWKEYLNKAG
ncbi:hypothetical protein NC652_041634 [Populus alba x Populus x berolinensis]|nr:hypothetical protein NC652_041634 [Populus alba x Populus x berolinensis]